MVVKRKTIEIYFYLYLSKICTGVDPCRVPAPVGGQRVPAPVVSVASTVQVTSGTRQLQLQPRCEPFYHSNWTICSRFVQVGPKRYCVNYNLDGVGEKSE